MKAKPVIPRQQANRDIDATLARYLGEDSAAAALGFIETVEQAYAHIARHPAAGSVRYAHEPNLPGLRFWPLKRSPYLLFYIANDTHIDVWRMLHGKRDIPAWLQANDTP